MFVLRFLNSLSKTQIKLANEKIDIAKKNIEEAYKLQTLKLNNNEFDIDFYKSKAINEANREDLEYWRGVLNTATQVFEHTEKYLQSEENKHKESIKILCDSNSKDQEAIEWLRI